MSGKAAKATEFEVSGWESGTPERKARLVNSLLRFIAADCPRDKFTKSLYLGLSTHGYFSFIAHYDIHGFYDEQLSTPERRARFISELRRDCERDRHSRRPDIWSDVKDVLAKRLSPREAQTATSARGAQHERRASAPRYDGPTLF